MDFNDYTEMTANDIGSLSREQLGPILYSIIQEIQLIREYMTGLHRKKKGE